MAGGPGLDSPGGCEIVPSARGAAWMQCDGTIGGVDQKQRPRQAGVIDRSTCADRESHDHAAGAGRDNRRTVWIA